ncbi:signal transduction histidine kinase [Spirosoma lacussanchae]|uniref:tetratricopeptide repeat-containing sensor histidine kinase n=1 Tax=Spirosoma lacussanchae TaxID=1884249 RepID=UPI0011087384|nr:ATP-binding protein [Spirosoma lacussanchae]
MKLLFTGIALLVFQTTWAQSYSIAQLRQQLTEARHDTVRIRLYNELAQLFNQQKTPDSAYVMAMAGIKLAHQHKLALEESRLYMHLGNYYKRLNQYREARGAFATAIQIGKQTGITPLQCKLLYRLACVYGDLGEYHKLVETISASRDMAEQLNDSIQLFYAYDLLASVNWDINNRPLALQYVRKLHQLARQMVANDPGKQKYMLFAEEVLADLYEKNGQYARAYLYRKRAFSYYIAHKSVTNLPVSVVMVANNLVRQQRSREAIAHLDESFRRGYISPTTSTNVFEIYALAYQQLGQFDKSLFYARKAYKLALQKKHSKHTISALTTLIELEEYRKLYTDALTHLRQLHEIRDSLFTLEKSKAIAQVEARYQLTEQKQTIELLRKDSALRKISLAKSESELTNQQQRQTILTLFALLLVVSVAFLFTTLRREKTNARLLAAQKEDIEDKANQLQAANALKDNLFTIIGHDLRSPIASLKAQLTGIKEGFVSPDAFSARVSLLSQKVDSVYTTLDNLLHFSLLQQKGLHSRLTQVELAETIESVVQLYDAEIRAKQLIVHKTYSPVVVWADEHQLHIIGRNILQNAIKFTPAGGSIQLITRRQNDYAVLLIKDSGVGMETSQPADQANRHLSRRGTAGEHGTGLGLQICRELVQLNKGQLHFESTPGQGTTVTVGFPEYQQATVPTAVLLQ